MTAPQVAVLTITFIVVHLHLVAKELIKNESKILGVCICVCVKYYVH